MKKLKAFTLMELLIGMIISTIVIGFCYMSYTIIYEEFMNYKTIKKELIEAMQFNSILNQDITSSERVLFDENKLMIIKGHNLSLEYNFEQTSILRKDGEAIDTFRLVPLNIVPAYLMNQDKSMKALVVSLSFDVFILGEQEHFQFEKTYDAETIFNADIQNLQNN